jgi:hypothetical protein
MVVEVYNLASERNSYDRSTQVRDRLVEDESGFFGSRVNMGSHATLSL